MDDLKLERVGNSAAETGLAIRRRRVLQAEAQHLHHFLIRHQWLSIRQADRCVL